MKTWLFVSLIILGVYALGVIGMALYTHNMKLAWFWPLTLLWMLFGNIQ